MSLFKHFWTFIITPAIPHSAFKMKVTFCVTAVFTAVLAKHSKSFSLIDCISVGVDRMQRNFEPMRKQVETWQKSELTDVTAKVVICEAFVEGSLEAPKHLARTVHDLYFEPKYEEFRPRTIWSLSNAFTSAFKELEPIPQFKATVTFRHQPIAQVCCASEQRLAGSIDDLLVVGMGELSACCGNDC